MHSTVSPKAQVHDQMSSTCVWLNVITTNNCTCTLGGWEISSI